MVGAGLGYAPGMPDGQSEVGSMIELGLGYTWRRWPRIAGGETRVRTDPQV